MPSKQNPADIFDSSRISNYGFLNAQCACFACLKSEPCEHKGNALSSQLMRSIPQMPRADTTPAEKKTAENFLKGCGGNGRTGTGFRLTQSPRRSDARQSGGYPFGKILLPECVENRIERTFDNAVKGIERKVHAMVRHSVLGEVVGPDAF